MDEIQTFTELVHQFSQSSTDEEWHFCNDELIKYRDSDDGLQILLAVLESALSLEPLVIACRLLTERIANMEDDANDLVEEIFKICMERSSASLKHSIRQRIMYMLSICVYYKLDLLDQILEVLNIEDQMAVVCFVLETENAHIFTGRVCIQKDLIHSLLVDGDIRGTWLDLYKFGALRLSYDELENLNGKLEEAIENFDFEWGTSLSEAYEEVVGIIQNNCPESYEFGQGIVLIMMTLCERLMEIAREDEYSVQASGIVSSILTSTLDGMEEFYSADVEFAQTIFDAIEHYLNAFLELDIEEFFRVLTVLSTLLPNIDDESRWTLKYIEYVIEAINAHPDEMCVAEMTEIIRNLIDTDDAADFLREALQSDDKTGVFHVLANAEEESAVWEATVEEAVRTLYELPLEQVPYTALDFIMTFVEYTPSSDIYCEVITMMANIAQSMLDQCDNASGALLALVKIQPDALVTEDESFLKITVSAIQQENPEQAVDLFATAFVITPHFPEGVTEKLEELQEGLAEFMSSFESFEEYSNFFAQLIKSIGDYGESECMHEFYTNLFVMMSSAFDKYWLDNDDEVQSVLARVISRALKYKWIADHTQVIDWVNEMFPRGHTYQYFSVIRHLAGVLPIPAVTEFLSNIESYDEEEVCKEISVLGHLLHENTEAMMQLPFGVYLYPITLSGDPYVKGLDMLINVYIPQVGLSETEFHQVIDMVTDSIFSDENEYNTEEAVMFLRSLGEKSPVGGDGVKDLVEEKLVETFGEIPKVSEFIHHAFVVPECNKFTLHTLVSYIKRPEEE